MTKKDKQSVAQRLAKAKPSPVATQSRMASAQEAGREHREAG
jgi:hypothetical protein